MRRETATCAFQPYRRLGITGPPGSGKWTLADQLSSRHCWCHIDISHFTPSPPSPHSLAAKLSSKDCIRGAVLHGFNTAQLTALNDILKTPIDTVIDLQGVGGTDRKDRIIGRFVHENSGRRYHPRYHPPKQLYIDDNTGEGLVCRLQDDEAGYSRRDAEYSVDIAKIRTEFHTIGVEIGGKTIEEMVKAAESALFS